jgi:hypothetical protein
MTRQKVLPSERCDVGCWRYEAIDALRTIGRFPPIADGQPANQYPTAAVVERHETEQRGERTPIRLRRLLETLTFPPALRHRAGQKRLADLLASGELLSRRLTVGDHLLRHKQLAHAHDFDLTCGPTPSVTCTADHLSQGK